MKTILSKPLAVLTIALIAGAIILAITLPNVGKPPVVESSLMQSVSATSTVPSNATVLSPDNSEGATKLAFQASGRVAAVNVKVGDHVTKGEILAELDRSVLAGALAQAKANLSLAQAQYGSLNLQYQNAKIQQDTLVENARRSLLSSGLTARPVGNIDESHNPTISGTYSCDTEGSYEIGLYSSGTESNYSFTVSGLEKGSGPVTYGVPQPLGTCGLFVTFVRGFSGGSKWDVDIPNTQSATYQANKNAYDLAVATRDQTLSQLAASIGLNPSANANTANAQINVAQGAYESALAQYTNAVITAPADGTVSFIDQDLKVGQNVAASKNVITIITQ